MQISQGKVKEVAQGDNLVFVTSNIWILGTVHMVE